jgi:hypothetical protein
MTIDLSKGPFNYRGYTILPTAYAEHIDAGEYYYLARSHEPSGLMLDERDCKRFASLADARSHVDELARQDAYERSRDVAS